MRLMTKQAMKSLSQAMKSLSDLPPEDSSLGGIDLDFSEGNLLSKQKKFPTRGLLAQQ